MRNGFKVIDGDGPMLEPTLPRSGNTKTITNRDSLAIGTVMASKEIKVFVVS